MERTSRREFLRRAGGLAGLLALGGCGLPFPLGSDFNEFISKANIDCSNNEENARIYNPDEVLFWRRGLPQDMSEWKGLVLGFHGMFGSKKSFNSTGIRVNNEGYGLLAWSYPEKVCSFDELAQGGEQVIRDYANDLRDNHVAIGFSIGGPAALTYALNAEVEPRGLILVNTAHKHPYLIKKFEGDVPFNLWANSVYLTSQEEWGDSRPGKDGVAMLVRDLEEFEGDLRNYEGNVLYVTSEDDPIFTPDVTSRTLDLLNNRENGEVRHYVFRGRGHEVDDYALNDVIVDNLDFVFGR